MLPQTEESPVHRTRTFKPFFLSTCALLLSSASFGAELPEIPDLTGYAFVKTAAGAEPVLATVDQAADALKDYDAVLFGEWHDHPGNHLAEMALFRALAARTPKLALSLEQFERDVQPVLDAYVKGAIGEEALRQRGRAWGNYAESYRPLVEYAKERAIPVIAANAPAAIVRCVGQAGPEYLSRLPADKRGQAAAELHLAAGPYRDKFFRFLDESGSHGPDEKSIRADGKPTDAALRAFASQVTRDDTMAESIARHIEKNPGAKVFHLAGDFHVEDHLGTAERLKLLAPNLKIAVIAPIEPSRIEEARKGANEFHLVLKPAPELYANEAEKKAAEDQIRAMMGRARNNNACAS
jgi:uncharacterized iron-regulated protein